MERKPKWKQALRVDRAMSFELQADAARIFPLLCPVREYEWIPDWRCTMLYSGSGVAEKDAVFTTRMFGKTVPWYCIVHEPPRLVEYLFVLGPGAVVKLSVRLEAASGGSTRVTWAMLFTMTRTMSRLAAKVTSREGFDAMIGVRKRQLEEFLARGD